MKSFPPFRLLRLLKFFCPPHLLEEIEGDLLQRFEQDVKVYGAARAKRRMLWNVVRYFRPGILLRNKMIINNSMAIISRNNITMAWRRLRKEKAISSINIVGLTLGLVVGLLIIQYALYHLRFDTFHNTADTTYRITTRIIENNSEVYHSASAPLPLGPVIKENIPDGLQVARLYSTRHWFDC